MATPMENHAILSVYTNNLDKNTKSRYLCKIKCIGSIDPYCLPLNQFDFSVENLPNITYILMFSHIWYVQHQPIVQSRCRDTRDLRRTTNLSMGG